jgi:hypothetical protein
MTITEKVKQAATNNICTLYKEGIFYKCYNEDAMVFVQKVKEYKVNLKFIKSVGDDVLSLGFPISETEKGNLSFENISERIGAKVFEDNKGYIVFSLNDISLKKDYATWKNSIQAEVVETVKEPTILYLHQSGTKEIISMIKNFDLANSTPMQGLSFIQQLKLEAQKIEEYNGNN